MSGYTPSPDDLERELVDLHLQSGHVSELALLQEGKLRAERKQLLKDRFAISPRLNRHQRRARSRTKQYED